MKEKIFDFYFKKTFLSPEYNEETQSILDKPSKENENRKNAITKYRIIDSNQSAALLELQPLTGRFIERFRFLIDILFNFRLT